jgi:hypothetical protein
MYINLLTVCSLFVVFGLLYVVVFPVVCRKYCIPDVKIIVKKHLLVYNNNFTLCLYYIHKQKLNIFCKKENTTTYNKTKARMR